MDITVLGCSAAFPRAGTPCSGFLVQGGEANVVLDLGSGTVPELLRHVSHRDLDAVVLSHRHADHIVDVVPLMYGLAFDPAWEGCLPVYAAPGVSRALLALLGGSSRDEFDKVFDFRPLEETFEVNGLRFESFRTVHPVETYGIRVCDGGGSAVYTADTAWFPQLPDACRDADLLICEATFILPGEGPPDVHLWADEAGTLAQKAEAERLILTHVWGTHDPHDAVALAATTFDGELEAAAPGARYSS